MTVHDNPPLSPKSPASADACRSARAHRASAITWLVLASMLASLGTFAQAATFTVGTDPATCDYTSLATAIAATQANGPGADTIRLGSSTSVPAAGLLVANQNLTIDGGYTGCTGTTAPARSLSGSVASTDALLRIECLTGCTAQRQVTLRNLILQDGLAGGMRIRGNVVVTTQSFNTSFAESDADGAGIHLDASGGARLQLGPGTVLFDNLADADGNGSGAGGGIYCTGHSGTATEFDLDLGRALIYSNTAVRGGGVALDAGCRASFSGDALLQGIDTNFAIDGGGISVRGGAAFFATGTTAGARIINNNATNGGGIHVSGVDSLAELRTVTLDGNTVDDYGAAMYAEDFGRIVVGPSQPRCASATCNRITDNSATSGSGRGGALEARSGAQVEIDQALIDGNSARYDSAIRLLPFGAVPSPSLVLRNSIVSNNRGALGVVGQLASEILIDGVTFWNNRGNNTTPLLRTLQAESNLSQGGIEVSRSIFEETQGEFASTGATGEITVSCVVATRASITVPMPPDGLIASAGLLASTEGTYTLPVDSVAIDLCSDADAVVPNAVDYRGSPRGVDATDVVDVGGPFDAGAIESSSGAYVFRDGFEQG
jgi:hypothetical protein